MKFIWKYCRVWFLVSAIVIALFFSATMVATQNQFLANTISTVLGGERRVLVSGDPTKYQYFDKDASFRQFDPGVENFNVDENGRQLSDKDKKAQALEKARLLNEEIEEEGIVLLKNENNALPLEGDAPRVSVFGKNSADIVLGGSGSGGGNTEGAIGLYEGLENAGFVLNPELKNFYEGNSSGSGREANPPIEGGGITGLRIGETPYANYPSSVKSSYSQYDDAAIIVISRIGGEGFDLPRTMVTSYGGVPVEGAKEGQHYLELDANEEKLVEEVTKAGFDKVILLVNCSTSMELGFVEDNDGIDAALWIGSPGSSGTNAIGRVLKGEVNPSGRLVDTYVRDFTSDPTFKNFGDNMSSRGNEYTSAGSPSDYYFVEYEEGLYYGYRYYETRSYQEVYRFGEDGGFYEDSVVYPFGYGLSYSTFDWEIVEEKTTPAGTISSPDDEITITVKVTNNGPYAGKDVVQLYYSAPYYNGGIEKSHVVLGDYAKTPLIENDASAEVTLRISVEDMASYDYSDANGNGFKGYELEQGIYSLYVGRNAHQAWNQPETGSLSVNYYVPQTMFYEMDIDGLGDGNDNQFDDVSSYMQRYSSGLSRSSFVSTFPTTPTAEDREIAADILNALTFVYDDANAPYYAEEAPQHGKSGQAPQIYELLKEAEDGTYSASFDDELLEEMLNYITVEEMINLIGTANFNTARIDSIGKPATIDPDGPAGFTNFMEVGAATVYDTCFYASECVIGSTWNKDLAYDMGVMVGIEGQIGNAKGDGRPYSGWYAPAANIHRSPFGGRNWEYYSEDPLLSGKMGANVVQGAKSKGVYTYIKHFAVNEQETNRDTNGLVTWVDEQTLREIYLKPFQIIVEEGQTTAMMSSFNRIGTTWTGGSYNLITNVLRNEWGFKGVVITDYSVSNPYMPPDQMLRAGGDLYLSQSYLPSDPSALSAGMDSATQISLLRRAMKNVLYTVANSCAMNGIGEGVVYRYAMPMWMVWLIIINVVLVAGAAVWGFFAIRKGLKKSKQPQTPEGNVTQ